MLAISPEFCRHYHNNPHTPYHGIFLRVLPAQQSLLTVCEQLLGAFHTCTLTARRLDYDSRNVAAMPFSDFDLDNVYHVVGPSLVPKILCWPSRPRVSRLGLCNIDV